jgi:dynein heavy chain, axonemal
VKSPSSDLSWHKGAKRQMANLDRFIDELQTFDERDLPETTIRLVEELLKKIDARVESAKADETGSEQASDYLDALRTLHEWTKCVIKYYSLMLKRVKPLHDKVAEIEREVKEADQKLTSLSKKSQVGVQLLLFSFLTTN